MIKEFPTEELKSWFRLHQRALPWRHRRDPYSTWISEVMLQQTQVAVVIPYFERWLASFPTIAALAAASREEVIKAWEGLGYYSRARNLHEAAKSIVADFGGELPPDKLSSIKGIGPYTEGAILSFAFKQKRAAVDGNVLRVLSRYLALDEPIDLPSTRKKITHYAEAILPDEEPWLLVEGLIELGATLCTKQSPNCYDCPLRSSCLAYRHQLTAQLPKKAKKVEVTLLKRMVALIHCRGHYLLEQAKEGEIMADLFQFPYLEGEQKELLIPLLEKRFGFPLRYIKELDVEKHSFTRYRVQLFPHLLETDHLDERYFWKEKEKVATLPFSSGHRRILKRLHQ